MTVTQSGAYILSREVRHCEDLPLSFIRKLPHIDKACKNPTIRTVQHQGKLTNKGRKPGVWKMLLLVSPERRQSLLGAVTTLYHRLSSKSATKLTVLHFTAAIFASPASYLQEQQEGESAVSEEFACSCLQVCSQILGITAKAVTHM